MRQTLSIFLIPHWCEGDNERKRERKREVEEGREGGKEGKMVKEEGKAGKKGRRNFKDLCILRFNSVFSIKCKLLPTFCKSKAS